MLQFSFKKGKLTSKAGARFVELLGGDDLAFDNLYCVAFQMLDRQWLAKRATYMEFNVNYIPCFMFLVCEFIELGFSHSFRCCFFPSLFFFSVIQVVLKSTRMQLEQELSLEGISCVRDMPAYRMLST